MEVIPTMESMQPLRGRLVLELGCGKGRFTTLVAKSAATVVAMDFSLAVMKRLASRIESRWRIGLVGGLHQTCGGQPCLPARALHSELESAYPGAPAGDVWCCGRRARARREVHLHHTYLFIARTVARRTATGPLSGKRDLSVPVSTQRSHQWMHRIFRAGPVPSDTDRLSTGGSRHRTGRRPVLRCREVAGIQSIWRTRAWSS